MNDTTKHRNVVVAMAILLASIVAVIALDSFTDTGELSGQFVTAILPVVTLLAGFLVAQRPGGPPPS